MSARQAGKNLTRIFDKMIATIVCSKERTLPGPIGGIAARTVRGKDFDGGGGDTGKQYRICAGAATNVCEIDENGRPTLGLCFLPMGDLPIGDVMLSQKIALESCEGRALAVARRFVPDGTFRRTRLLH